MIVTAAPTTLLGTETDPTGPEDTDSRVSRGGGHLNYAYECRVSERNSFLTDDWLSRHTVCD